MLTALLLALLPADVYLGSIRPPFDLPWFSRAFRINALLKVALIAFINL